MKALGFALAMALGIASGAHAASPEWNGFYAGLHGGYGTGSFSGCGTWNVGMGAPVLPVSWPPPCATGGNDYSIDGPFKGGFGGVQVGDNAQFGSVVLGMDLALALSGLEHRNVATSPATDIKMTLDWLTTATLHAGIAPGAGRVLGYGVIGLGAGYVHHSNYVEDCYYETGVGGLVYGAGAAVKVTDKISVFGEWNHLAFDDARTTCFTPKPGNTNNIFKTSADLFKAGLNFSLN